MMIVWWAVFFFAGALFPGSADGVPAGLCVAILLFLLRIDPHGRSGRISLLTSATALFVLLHGSLNPLEGNLAGSGRASVNRPEYAEAGMVIQARRYIDNVLEDVRLSTESRGMLKALLLADRSEMGWRTKDSWRAAGVAHYLAMSGMHLGLVATPLFLFLTLIGTRGVVRDSCGILVLSFYTAVAGIPGSLIRALALIASIRLYRLRGTRSGLASGALTCGFVVFVLSPASIVDTGFILSLAAVFGIALIGWPVSNLFWRLWPGWRYGWLIKGPIRLLILSACIQAFILPLTVELFGISPLAGPLMSLLLAVPVISILYSGVMFAVAGRLVPSMSAPLIDFLVSVSNRIAARGACFSYIGVTASDFSAITYLCGLAICSVSFRVTNRRRVTLAAGLAIMTGSFLPVISGPEKGDFSVKIDQWKSASVYGGQGGVLALSGWLHGRNSAELIRKLRRTGIRSIDTIVVLAPVRRRIDGNEPLIRDLNPELLLISPWSDAEFTADVRWTAVLSDTLLLTGGGRVAVSPPCVFPRPGSAATGADSHLSISPLD